MLDNWKKLAKIKRQVRETQRLFKKAFYLLQIMSSSFLSDELLAFIAAFDLSVSEKPGVATALSFLQSRQMVTREIMLITMPMTIKTMMPAFEDSPVSSRCTCYDADLIAPPPNSRGEALLSCMSALLVRMSTTILLALVNKSAENLPLAWLV